MNNLTDDNFNLFAARYYDNPHCLSEEEFEDDLKRFRYLKRLFRKYKQTGELKDRLIINHFVVLYNVFHHRAATKIICFKLYDELTCVKPFLIMLGYWPDRIEGVNGEVIVDSNVALDGNIAGILRETYGV